MTTDWRSLARRAAEDYDHQWREQRTRDTEQTVEYLERFAEQLGLAPTRGTARLGWGAEADDDRVVLNIKPGDGGGQLVIHDDDAEGQRPVVRLYLDGRDAGPVETLIDVGHALANPTAYADERSEADEPEVGDLLLQVVQGLVRDVVEDVLTERLEG